MEKGWAEAPHARHLGAWLGEARVREQAGRPRAGLVLLRAGAGNGTAERRQAVLPELAGVLEGTGAFREAALLYRELLRPSLD